MEEYGLIERCKLIQCREAKRDEALLVHDGAHIDLLKQLSNIENIDEAEQMASNYDSTYFNKVLHY